MSVALLAGRSLALAGDRGTDLTTDLLAALQPAPGLVDGDVLVVPVACVSHAEGRVVALGGSTTVADLVASEALRVLRLRTGDRPAVAETRHGFVLADAGVVVEADGSAARLLPVDPDRSARRLRATLEARTRVRVGVVVAARAGDPWRRGERLVAVGCAGLPGGAADTIAAAAGALFLGPTEPGRADARPVVVRGLDPSVLGTGSVAADVVLPAREQRFR